MAVLIGGLIGGLLICLLISRLLLYVLKGMGDTMDRIALANGLSLLVCFVMSGFGTAHGNGFNPYGVALYILPQIAVFAFDSVALKGRRSQGTAGKNKPRGRLEL